jgi:hypothetical protein
MRKIEMGRRNRLLPLLPVLGGTNIDEDYLTEGVPDVKKIDPILYGPVKGRTELAGSYWTLGKYLAGAWEVGRELRK